MKALSLLLSLTLSGLALAEDPEAPKPAVELGAPFNDNAVLQREVKVPVWGWAKPGEKVTVSFGEKSEKATAGEDGKWMLELDPLTASFIPREMTITESSGDTRTLKNILVGEVWMASGQSNMQWNVSKSAAKTLTVEPKDGVNPIRECAITDYFASLHPIEHATGEWKDGNYGDYSAIAFSFAHKLYEELGVPIGILNCSFSQTSIEAWTPREGFADGKEEYTREVYQKILETDPTTPEHKQAWAAFYEAAETTLAENAERVKKGEAAVDVSTKVPGNFNGNRDASWLFNARLNPVIPYAIKGAIWNQGYANMGGGFKYYQNLHSMIRGWRQCWERPELPVYFHQFYSAGKGYEDAKPAIGQAADMRLATWLARDIPNTGMASQIDIEGAIHYGHKVVPGRRLALHALKNQYAKDVVADGPMFKSYQVDGNKVIVEFEHAEGGLVVAETRTNALGKEETGATGFADPTVIEDGADQVKHFYLAGEDRVWHPAKLTIDGKKAILTSDRVKNPRGVSYGSGGIGFTPNLYNKALLPMTPFIFYDQEMVTAETWPDDPMKIAGVELDPSEGGILYEYRKMPILSTQFRDNAVLQADEPVTIWGSAVHDWGYEANGEAVIKFSFSGGKETIEKTIPVTPGMEEWQVELPAMEAGTKPHTLKVSLHIDGELAHERVAENIIFGDVWYVAAPSGLPVPKVTAKSDAPVRMMTRKAKRSSHTRPSRFSVAVSTTPLNRFASLWEDANGAAAAIGHRIGSKTGRPVGIVFMQTVANKNTGNPPLKEWIPPVALKEAPSLMEDYKQLAAIRPGNEFYDANVQRYLGVWKDYWANYIPEMMKTKRVPDGVPWGVIPSLGSSVETAASETYNVLVHSFGPGNFKGVVFLASPEMVAGDEGAHFGEQLTALANSWKGHFGGDPVFLFTSPSKALAPKITNPKGIQGKSAAFEISSWKDATALAPVFEAAAAETAK